MQSRKPEQPIILILPGWQDSGPEHWQNRWLKKYPNAVKVVQKDWMYPKKEEWVKTLNEYIEKYKDLEIVLVGHSLACATIAYWSKEYFSKNKAKIKGALFVCASNVDRENFPKEIEGFRPMPLEKLNFKTIVVASDNDPSVDIDTAKHFAKSWGAEFINIGLHGHINIAAGFGDWPEGEIILERLLA